MTIYDTACEVHRHHTPKPLRTVDHHLQPLAMGGADTPVNKVVTCDTGHYNIHRLLGDLIRSGKMRRGGTPDERRLARIGFQRWNDAGRPGRPVYELRSKETR